MSMFRRLSSGMSDMMSAVGLSSSDAQKLQCAILSEDENKAINLVSGSKKHGAVKPSVSINPSPKGDGNTPLHLAAEYAMTRLIDILLDNDNNSGNPNTLNATEQTSLHSLCKLSTKIEDRLKLLEQLLSWKKDSSDGEKYTEVLSINRVDIDGSAAIHYASMNGLTSLVRRLVDVGAIISIVNKSNKTCCELAESNGHHQLSSMLELALIFQPVDVGMEDFDGAADEDDGIGNHRRNLPMYCLDCMSMNMNNTENFMNTMIDRTGELFMSIGEGDKKGAYRQPSERVETLLQQYDWDQQALLEEYSKDPSAVLSSARLAVAEAAVSAVSAVTTPGVEESNLKNAQPIEAASILMPPPAPEPVHTLEREFELDKSGVVAKVEKVAAEIVADVVSVAEAKCRFKEEATEEDSSTSPFKERLEQELKEGEECPICCEVMTREVDFDSIMQHATSLLQQGKDEHEVCVMNTVSSESNTGLSCRAGHKYCLNCWSQHVTGKIRDDSFADLTCPGFQCGETIHKKWAPFLLFDKIEEKCDNKSNSTVNTVNRPRLSSMELDPASHVTGLLGRYRRSRINRFIDCNKGCHNCPVPECGMVLLVPPEQLNNPLAVNQETPLPHVIQCSAGHSMCLLCQSDGHAPCSCKQWKDWQETVRKEIQGVEGMEDGKGANTKDVAFSLWLSANTKKCPRCSTAIEKDEGCNHMICSKCRHEFCWMCMEKWSLHSNSTGGYFQCNKFVDTNNDTDDIGHYSKIYDKGSSRYENKRMEMNSRKMARFIHHFTRYNAHEDSAKREVASRLETLQRIEYSLYGAAIGDLPWLHGDVVPNPAIAAGTNLKKPTVMNAMTPGTGISESGATATSGTPTSTPTKARSGSIVSKVSKAANSLSKWFSPSKGNNSSSGSSMKKSPGNAADAAYASENFQDHSNNLSHTDGPDYLAFLRDGFDELARARKFLQGSYIHAYYLFEACSKHRNWRRHSRLAELQSIYETLQGELEFLVEMLSDVLARRRLRASKFQINQLVHSIRFKRMEMENAVLCTTANHDNASDVVPMGMTSLSRQGSLGGASNGVRLHPDDMGTPRPSRHSRPSRGRLTSPSPSSPSHMNDDELMDMIELISQLDHERPGATAPERDEMRSLLDRSMTLLAENGIDINANIGDSDRNEEGHDVPSDEAFIEAENSQIRVATDVSDDEEEHATRAVRLRGSPRRMPTRVTSPTSSDGDPQDQVQEENQGQNQQNEESGNFPFSNLPDNATNEMTEEMHLQSVLLMSMQEEPTTPADSSDPGIERNIELLVSAMGISEAEARTALEQNGHNVEAAINSLLAENQ